MSGLLVIGIGNPDCGDDAIGPMVVQRLVGRLPPEVAILARAGDMLGMIEDWTGRDGVVLVDAAAPATAAGTIHRIDLLSEALPDWLSLASTHAFGVVDAVGLARALGQLPGRLIVYAIEGVMFDPGALLSPAVLAVAETVAVRVAAELGCLATDARMASATSRRSPAVNAPASPSQHRARKMTGKRGPRISR